MDKLCDAKLIGFCAIIEKMGSSSVSLYVPVTYPVDFKMDSSPYVIYINESLFIKLISEKLTAFSYIYNS